MRRVAGLSPLVVAATLALACAAGCNTNGASVPSQPAYDVDVRPILMAHCARCHGAGGTLNVPTQPTGPNAPVLPSVQPYVDAFKAFHCYLDEFTAMTPDCVTDGGGLPPDTCHFGAAYWASTGLLHTTIHSTNPMQEMPPAPAPRLDDWAIQTLDDWSAEQPPICSHSSNPDPAICPDGP